eukprot:1800690-Pyramimonas_sp.AAC.1
MNEETYTPETTARAPEDGDKEEPEFEGRPAHVRVHARPRVALFTPRGLISKLEKTTMGRITVIKYEDGSEETVKGDNWNANGKSTRSTGRRWTGRTYLFPIADKPEEMK